MAMDIERIHERYGVDLSADDISSLWEEIRTVLMGFDRSQAIQLAASLARRPFPLSFIYLELIQPVLYFFGDESAIGKIPVIRLQIASALAQSMLATCYYERLSGLTPTRPTVVVSSVAGNLHAIGPRMIADLLEEARYQVIYTEPPVEQIVLLDFVNQQQPAVVALSVAMPEQLPTVWQTAENLRRNGYTKLIAVGGYALHNHNNHRWQAYGIDWAGTDILDFLHWLDQQ